MSAPITQAIVLAAGEGRRLRPVTLHTPKPLVPFFGRPLLDWAIEKLAAAGVRRIAVNAWHLADQIVAHVDRLRGLHAHVELHVEREPELLGTGGAVRNLRRWLTPNEPFFVLNSDSVFAESPRALVGPPSPSSAGTPDRPPGSALPASGRPQLGPALLVTRSETYRSERRLIADADHRFARLDEAGDPARGFTFCGLTLADPALPDRLPDGPSCILRQGFVPFLADLAVRLVETTAFFADTGTPEALIDAHARGLDWVRTLPAPA